MNLIKKYLQKELDKARNENQKLLSANTRLQDEIARLKEKEKQRENNENNQEPKDLYVKKTMIFKQEYLDIINGLSAITNTEIKGTLNTILELGIKEIEKQKGKEVIDKALKTSKKKKQEKAKDLIF